MSEVAQSCPTLCDPMDCSLPRSSIHGIFQARVLEWGAIAFQKKTSLKLTIQKMKILAFGPMTLWQIDGETMETVTNLIFLGSNITAAGGCNHEIKRHLLLGRKAMINLDSILKSRDVTLPTKFHLVKAIVFLVVMYGCESWTIKKAEHRKIDAFELWYWRRLLRVLGQQRDQTSPS